MGDTSKMPWKDTGPVQERKQFIEDWLAGGRCDQAGGGLDRTYGICRKTGHKWVQPFLAAGRPSRTDCTRPPDRAGLDPAEMELRFLPASPGGHPSRLGER